MNNIICGNVLEHLHDIPRDAFLISDPPYNQDYHYGLYDDKVSTDEYRDLLYQVFQGMKLVIIHYPEETINLLATLDIGKCEQSVAWVYNSNTAKQHRSITWWNCKPDMTAVGQAYKNPTDKRIAKRIAEGKQARLYDWWDINQVKNVSKKGNPHPCPIPYELAERIILITTKPGDMVVDPFVGSGTVCLAAKNNGRNYLGFDIDPVYVEYANILLSKEQ